MEFSKGEAKLLLALAVLEGGEGDCSVLCGLFHRRGEFLRTRDGLVRHGFVVWDSSRDVLRVLVSAVGVAMGLYAPSTSPLAFDERPLDAALASVCGSATGHMRSPALRAEIAHGARISHGGGEGREFAGESCVSEGTNGTKVNGTTFIRSDVGTIKRSTFTLEERVRDFVGDDDWARHWARASYLWRDGQRRELLDGSLNFLRAGIRDGSVKVRKSKGAALWFQVRMDWERHVKDSVASG